MTLIIMRHGAAIRGGYKTPDEGRWLTEEGRIAARVAGLELARQNLQIDTVVTSPLVRAVQTAEQVAAALEFGGAIPSLESLRSEGLPQAALEDLNAAGGVVLAVTHEPMASELCEKIAGHSHASLRTAEIRAFSGSNMLWRYMG